MNDSNILTVDEIARDLKVHPNSVRKWIKNGELIAINIGNEYRIRRSDYEDFLRRRQTARDGRQ